MTEGRRNTLVITGVLVAIGALIWWLSPTSLGSYLELIAVGLVILFYWVGIRDRPRR